ncbi:MAG: asparagine synthase (glutamine-hydrolyzing) [Deltaproteobacteria bacterium]|nr:MAG: asparagine synthase (glutamine-hydrolyzing) [Deltaproteobacteria bacterium]
MCGIAGIINFNASENMRPTLTRMIGFLHHRGPDASGIYMDGPAGLAHARLSIIDLSGGDQPIHNEDRSVWIVFNGEIFNYPELRERLVKSGHQFYTQSDTEVLVHLYEEYGSGLFEYLNGQFALALWDQNRQSLLLGRDRMGIRPLFYYQKNNRLVFGSEIKALFADRRVPRALDTQSLSDIFTCWSPLGDSTPFKDVLQIPPGHYAESSKSGLKVTPYWKLSFRKNDDTIHHRSLHEWTEEISHLMHDATRIRLRADVPVGAYLSGGLDSTYTSALVKQNFNNRLRTFSVSFTDKRFDESGFQQKAVSALGTDHQTIPCSEADIGRVFPKVIWHTESPILRTAPAPLFRLSRLVRENNFKVVLTGEGADEIFAGYNIFREDKVRRFWAKNPASTLRPRLLEKLYPYIFAGGSGKARVFLENFFKKDLQQIESPVYSHMLRWKNTAQLQSFFTDDLRAHNGNLNIFIDRYQSQLPPDFMSWEPLSRAQYTESKIFLSNYLLCSQGDRMAMAHSIEGRYPFLDHRVVELAAQIPAKYRMRGLNEKFVLKKAAQGVIPDTVRNRSKQPYRAPIARCFFGKGAPAYVGDLLSKDSLKKTGYFNPGKVSKLIAKCRRQHGRILSERENMALVGILSTQLLDKLFIRDFDPVR